MGLRRRVSIGFMSIVGVLILSGMVSFFELNTLSRDTDNILFTNARYGELSRSMLDALNEHNRQFVHMTAFRDRSYDSLCLQSVAKLDSAISIARRESIVPEVLDSMMVVAMELRAISNEFISAPISDSLPDMSLDGALFAADSLNKQFGRFMYERYLPIHDNMLDAIEFYDNESDRALAPRAEQLHNNAYRAVTPILLSLTVMIVIVLMLYYFVMLYCVKPVEKINSALLNYLLYKVPFAPKVEKRDELHELSESIELLIKQGKVNKEG